MVLKFCGFARSLEFQSSWNCISFYISVIIHRYSMKWKLESWKTLWVAKSWTWFSTSLKTTIKSSDWSTLQRVSITTGRSIIIPTIYPTVENTTNFKDLHIKDWLSKMLKSFKINSSRVYVIRHLKTVTVFRFKRDRFWVYNMQRSFENTISLVLFLFFFVAIFDVTNPNCFFCCVFQKQVNYLIRTIKKFHD